MDDELYHYGVKGMKWGVRRTPAQLGHDTGTKRKKRAGSAVEAVKSAAKKVGSAVSEKASQAKAKRVAKQLHDDEVKKTQKNQKKKISELTDDELRERIVRMQLEQQYRNLTPQKQSAGKKFVSTLGNQVIGPAVTNVARDYLQKSLRKALGLEGNSNADPLKELRAEVDKLNLENKKGALKDSIKKREAEHKKAKQESNKTNDDSQQRTTSSNTQERTTSSNTQQRTTTPDPEPTYETPRNSTTSRGQSYVNDIIEITDYTIEDVPTRSALAGSEYVRGLLGPGSDDERYRR